MKATAILFLVSASTHALIPSVPSSTSARASGATDVRAPTSLASTIDPSQSDLDHEAQRELKSFAADSGIVDFFDPLQLSDQQFWGLSNAATIKFLRHAEMKHGRIAMLGCLGYTIQANGWTFPWATEAHGFPPSEISPPDQWDLLDPFGKFQLFFFIGALELWSEAAPGAPHYMQTGGVPGKFPPFTTKSGTRLLGLPADLWDPLGSIAAMDDKTKAAKLAKEVNNGRLAMLGMFGFLVESKIPGAVPVLTALHVVQPYSGEYWQAFGYWDFLNFFLDESTFSASSAAQLGLPSADFGTPW